MDREAADLVAGDLDVRAVMRLDPDRGGLSGNDLAEQGVLGDLELDGYPGGREGEGTNGCRLGAGARRGLRSVCGVIGELCELSVDVVPREGVLAGFNEFGRHSPAGSERLAQRCQELFVIPAVSHHAHPFPACIWRRLPRRRCAVIGATDPDSEPAPGRCCPSAYPT